ncbi:hypothetical protein DMB42_13470 [Nonomuraea sp. WAC 01424]|uniref:hypothetical protein n=1 Tax=Nonomuraea sp. WAC 01424 TaxID=2203200 RepID=UPI000F7BA4FD|nr:hypothetical protein [Nonomuraea sp. WAC 01424]RSN11585.1 hypothetical protein DMB42_13470 [Nonomuraea sp. WAC 01424]
MALAAPLGAGLLTAPAADAAPDQKTSHVKRIKPVQSVITYVSIKDSVGQRYPIKVTTTWAYKSPKSALLRSIVIRENGFPKNFCNGDTKAYSVMRTVKVRSGSPLGQLWIRTPNPGHPRAPRARWAAAPRRVSRPRSGGWGWC